LPTDLHGLKMVRSGLSVKGYAFLPLSCPAVSLSSYKRVIAVPADWGLDWRGMAGLYGPLQLHIESVEYYMMKHDERLFRRNAYTLYIIV